jgi:hypothetical protein
MRSDIVPGGIFPNYELPDHTGQLRKLSELQGEDPLILTREAIIAQRSTSSIWNSPRSTRRSRWRTRRLPRFLPTTTTLFRNSARRSEPSGPFFRIPTEPFSKFQID